jgi:hypothetical protein
MVIKCLKEGLKVSCPVYSLDYLKDLDSSVKAEIPSCRILLISSEHGFDSVDEFVNYELVIYTSKLLCGNNFNECYFDIIIPLISNLQSSAKLYSQQILRIRQFKKMTIFVNMSNTTKMVCEEEILTRWRYDYDERNKKGIVYSLLMDDFKKDFYFKLMLNQTLEIENAGSLLLQELFKILGNHGFVVSGNCVADESDAKLLIKYDKTIDYHKIIDADIITDRILSTYKYTPHEYSKHLIIKTFGNQLVPSPEGIEFVKCVHDIIPNHNNFMILHKYGVDDAVYIQRYKYVHRTHDSTTFIPSSKSQMKDRFLLDKGLDFIKKYDVMGYVNNDKVFDIENGEFVKWYNVRDEYSEKIVPKLKSVIQATKAMNALLKIHGMKLISRQISSRNSEGKRERKRVYFILTLIKYDDLYYGTIKLKTLRCQDSDFFDHYLKERATLGLKERDSMKGGMDERGILVAG